MLKQHLGKIFESQALPWAQEFMFDHTAVYSTELSGAGLNVEHAPFRAHGKAITPASI
jgi:hypothetical protein